MGKMKLIMTLLVRDAAGILRENIDFHIGQGVDFFIITDNASVDGTAQIIREYCRAGIAEYIWEPGDDFSQARWVTRMARRAATAYAADWVINCDDDEFWSARSGSLREAFAGIPPECEALVVDRFNHPPVAGQDANHFLRQMIYREVCSKSVFGDPLPPKLCHRGFSDIEIAQGNHSASRLGRPLADAESAMIVISHFPVRDYAAFEHKIATGGAAYTRNTELDPGIGATWRWLYQVWLQGGLRDWYDRQLLRPEQIIAGLGEGKLVRDETVLHAVRAS
jgi:glycosyl transferase family 2